jgi:hypothetical protein
MVTDLKKHAKVHVAAPEVRAVGSCLGLFILINLNNNERGKSKSIFSIRTAKVTPDYFLYKYYIPHF